MTRALNYLALSCAVLAVGGLLLALAVARGWSFTGWLFAAVGVLALALGVKVWAEGRRGK